MTERFSFLLLSHGREVERGLGLKLHQLCGQNDHLHSHEEKKEEGIMGAPLMNFHHGPMN